MKGRDLKNASETDSIGHDVYFDTEDKGGEVKDDSPGKRAL